MTKKSDCSPAPQECIVDRLNLLGADCQERHWHKNFHTVQDAISCIREQQAALEELVNAAINGHADTKISAACSVISKWEIK